MFLPHPRVEVSIVGSLCDREVACSASDRQGSNFESCIWRTVSSQSFHHPQEVLLAQFSLYVHKGGLKPDSFHFIKLYIWHVHKDCFSKMSTVFHTQHPSFSKLRHKLYCYKLIASWPSSGPKHLVSMVNANIFQCGEGQTAIYSTYHPCIVQMRHDQICRSKEQAQYPGAIPGWPWSKRWTREPDTAH